MVSTFTTVMFFHVRSKKKVAAEGQKAAAKSAAFFLQNQERELNPAEAARSYSSVKDFRDSFSAAGHHDSTLDSKTGWTPARSELGGEPWVQIDAGGSVQLKAVVVQSWRDWSVHGVSKVRVETSADARSWTQVEGGRTWGTPIRRNGRNRCAFSAAVTCRYVRIVGVDFTRGGNHGASMRCGLVVSTEPANADTAPPPTKDAEALQT